MNINTVFNSLYLLLHFELQITQRNQANFILVWNIQNLVSTIVKCSNLEILMIYKYLFCENNKI
jgi:hypothetical protein